MSKIRPRPVGICLGGDDITVHDPERTPMPVEIVGSPTPTNLKKFSFSN